MPEPIPSAAAIILSDEKAPRVLLARRAEGLKFMGGHHVFPGGRIGKAEGSAHVVGAVDDEQGVAIHAAAREAFEETGLLCVQGGLPPREGLRSYRRALLAGEEVFDAMLDRFGLTIRAGDFEPAGVWVTPAGLPIRFHARYYLYRHCGQRHEELVAGEIVGLDWLGAAEARRRWRAGLIRLPAPVAYTLGELARFDVPEAVRRMNRASAYMRSSPGAIEFRCGVYVLPLEAPTIPPARHTNCCVVGERELYVIDPGTPHPAEQASLKGRLDHLLEPGGKVAAVLLTHSHPDHVGAATFVAEQYGVPIWAHAETARQVGFSIDRQLADGERIAVAGDPDWVLRCIHTPGHDPGHLCFLEETTGTLLCGDLVAQGSSIAIWPDFGGDMTQYLDSLDRMLAEDFTFLIPSHGFVFGDPKASIREAITHRVEREEKVKSALAKGVRGLDALVPAVYDDVPRDLWPLARQTLAAHLIRLGVPLDDAPRKRGG